jgi:UDP-N-acetylmuramoylalanine--D-glutamate ligase
MFGVLQSPTVLVLGLGESGLAMARWCARHGCRLRIADTRAAPPHLGQIAADAIDAEFVAGPFTVALLDGIELIALSPGLSPLVEDLATLLAVAGERGVPVWGELEFFAQALAALRATGYTPRVLAVTGTNGKTTTTVLTGQLCARGGAEVAVAGNISPALLARLSEALDAGELPAIWVLELSSFQLAGASSFRPDAAAILNITEDHLDWHGGFEAYAAAKGRIFGAARPASVSPAPAADAAQSRAASAGSKDAASETANDAANGSADEAADDTADDTADEAADDTADDTADEAASNLADDRANDTASGTVDDVTNDSASVTANVTASAMVVDPGQPATIRILNRDDARSMAYAPAAAAAAALVTFGLGEPTRAGDYGLQSEAGMAWLVEAEDRSGDHEPPGRRRKGAAPASEIAFRRLMPVDALRIRGLHNAANALAALALARSLGLPLAPLLYALREYRGEPHRVALLATLNGIDYVDDSKGTNVGATVAALDGLAQRAVLIAGGEGKGQDFAPLVAPVARWCRAVVLIGRDAPLIRAALAETGVPLHDVATLDAATRTATALAQSGDAVLLSPACASFDMFDNYAHRAAAFHSSVQEIGAESGVML